MKCVDGDCENGEGRFVLFTPMYEGGFKDKSRHGEGYNFGVMEIMFMVCGKMVN